MHESEDYAAEDARTAAQMEADVGVEHIADVYAKALLGAAEGAGVTAGVLSEFNSLVEDLLDRFPRFDAVLASVLVSAEEKAESLQRVLGGQASPTFLNFLKVLARHGRLDCLRAIHLQVRAQYDELRGRVNVRITTAAPVGSLLEGRIADHLRAVLGGELIVQRTVDPELIGGIVVRVGDTIYDGSIANQLHVLREQMIDRSVHEIQSRRDRFRYPAGN